MHPYRKTFSYAIVDATLKAEQFKLENKNLQTELQELRRDLHESQECKARTAEEAQGRIVELEHRARESETGRTTELEKDIECLMACCEELENHLSKEAKRAELERYQMLEVVRRKWEAREEWLLEQLRQVEVKCDPGFPQYACRVRRILGQVTSTTCFVNVYMNT